MRQQTERFYSCEQLRVAFSTDILMKVGGVACKKKYYTFY